MKEREKIKQLFERYQRKECTPEEELRLHAWFNQYVKNEASGLEELQKEFEIKQKQPFGKWKHWLPYAAVFLLSVGTAGYFWLGSNTNGMVQQQITQLVPVGENTALLTFSDGRTIQLNKTHSGIVVRDEGISYENGNQELININPKKSVGMVLSTPKGSTYQIILSDGTKVWLNAASTLKYPSRFAADKRVVEIDGEAYFKVAKDRNKPFKVVSKGQEIEVLGTEFNVSAYHDEAEVKTTLIKGSVMLQTTEGSAKVSLVPGEQSVLTDSGIKKRQVDTGAYIAWKAGNFYFDNTPLSDVLKQISRWYNVDVVYENKVPTEMFSGTMSREVELQTVLELLRISEVKYRLEGNKLIIE